MPSDEPTLQSLSAANTKSPRHAWRWALGVMLVTLLGAFLRYYRLDQQAYWYDEMATLNRIRGSFEYMIKELGDQGFPPGWYALLRGYTLLLEKWLPHPADAWSIVATRSLPAFFGTIMIPAMYLLARQFLDRRGALIAAILTAVNPYLIYYSRDLKMYVALWAMLTVHSGLFFYWLFHRRQWLIFPLMVLTGAFAATLHGAAWLVLGLELFWLLFRPGLRALDGLLWALGMSVMAALPVWWYLNKTKWVTEAVENARFNGLDWIRDYTDLTWQTVAGLPVVHMFGFLWPEYPPSDKIISWFNLGNDYRDHLDTRSYSWLASAELCLAVFLLVILLAGIVPWRRWGAWWRGRKLLRHESPVPAAYFAFVTATWVIIPVAILALTWLPADSPWFRRVWGSYNVRPLWEPRYLGVIIPAWILWLAVAMRRLPLAPIRILVLFVVIAGGVFSSFSSLLVYRQAPWQVTAEVCREYLQKHPEIDGKRDTLTVYLPRVRYAGDASTYTFYSVFGMRPSVPPEGVTWRKLNLSTRMMDEGEYVRSLMRIKNNRRIQAFVMTDRLGDQVAGSLSDSELQNILGPQWHVAKEIRYLHFYEWRYYLFSQWRTRLWVKEEPAAAATKPTTTQAGINP